MSKSLEDTIADVPCAGASGTVGMETARKIVAAIEAAKAVKVPDEPKVEPAKVKPKVPEPKYGKKNWR